MKVSLIITGDSQQMAKISSLLQKELTSSGVDLEVIHISKHIETSDIAYPRLHRADLIVLGAPSIPWKGDIPDETKDFIEACTFLEGKTVAVFVDNAIWGADKALRKLMSALEKKGALLFDFEVLKNAHLVKEFAHRLISARKTSSNS
jgi:flavodoxin